MKTVYWVIAVILAAVALILLIGLGRPPSVSEASSDFCADVSDYAAALLEFRTIDANSTIDEVQAAGAAVRDSLAAVQSSAATLSEARIAELEATHDELQSTIQSIPSDATIGQAQAALRLSTLNALADAVKVMTTTCQITIPQGATTRPQR